MADSFTGRQSRKHLKAPVYFDREIIGWIGSIRGKPLKNAYSNSRSKEQEIAMTNRLLAAKPASCVHTGGRLHNSRKLLPAITFIQSSSGSPMARG